MLHVGCSRVWLTALSACLRRNMPIVLVTGLPGHGKTLYTLSRWSREAKSDNRPVWHNDIPGLTLDWQVIDPFKWFDAPSGSWVVIDEAQKVFGLRPRGSDVPKHVSALETHRHLGLDLVLVTQHPSLIDSHVRRLVDRHFHVVRKFGTHFATIYESPTGCVDYPEKVKRGSQLVRHEWRYPKDAFSFYKSSELHTVKRRLPARFWLLVALLVLIPLVLWFLGHRLYLRAHASSPGLTAGASAPLVPGVGASAGVRDAFAVAPGRGSTDFYLQQFTPRVPGLLHTAPIYDAMTRPAEVPYPAVCFFSSNIPCTCYTQKGLRYPMGELQCQKYARDPFDPYWVARPGRESANELLRGQDVGQSSLPPSPPAVQPAGPLSAVRVSGP